MPAPQIPQQPVFEDPVLQNLIQGSTQNTNNGTAHMPAGSVQLDPAKLADIQLPETITFWPPAPGWWFLLGLLIIILFVIIYFIKRKPPIKTATVKQLKSQAMTELHAIKKHYEAQPENKQITHKAIKDLSIFLRRYALSLYSREKVASITDKQWLKLLDNTYNSQFKKESNENIPLFSEKYADLLTQVPYQSDDQLIDHVLLSELFNNSETLINKTAKLFAYKTSHQKNSRQENSYRGNSHQEKKYV